MIQAKKVRLLALVATTYAMVSGGPYGLEDLVARAGYVGTAAILVVTPVLWSLPTAMLVGELGAAMPEEGGYYQWVKRGLGDAWGFQEAWLSLAASFFDMAIYPTLFGTYLAELAPRSFGAAGPIVLGALLIAASVGWNLRGARAVGGASVLSSALLLSPFVVLAGLAIAAPSHPLPPAPPLSSALVPGVLVAMWNYMGWDNASTFAAEVDDPGKTYPRAMWIAVPLVAAGYLIPVLALSHSGIDPSSWKAGSWVDAAKALGGPWLAKAVMLGGAVSAAGAFNALVLSYSRVPVALAEDGYLPRVFAKTNAKTGAPTLAIVVSGLAYAACLGLGFERLVELDVVLYGLSLVLEFAALIALRIREPSMPRPFRIPGGLPVAILAALGPLGLSVMAVVFGDGEGRARGGLLTLGVIVSGFVYYAVAKRFLIRPAR